MKQPVLVPALNASATVPLILTTLLNFRSSSSIQSSAERLSHFLSPLNFSLAVMSYPVTLPCGHSGCLRCFEQLVAASPASKCPVCRAKMPDRLTVNVCLNELSKKLPMKCLNNGCSWAGGCGDAGTHGIHCPKAVVVCGNEGCTVSAKREDMVTHSTTCPKEALPCQKCERPVTRELSQAHEGGGCAFSEVECPLACGEKFPRYLWLWFSFSHVYVPFAWERDCMCLWPILWFRRG